MDYYNEAEPWTTTCPFLPGQPINVLNVPIHLPSVNPRHKRESSMTSQQSIPQTMNPDDKYLNPRPPPRPRLPRLFTSTGLNRTREALTSPILSSPQLPIHGRSASHPRDFPARRKFRVPPRLALEVKAPETKGKSLRTAFLNITAPLSGMRDGDGDKPEYFRGRTPRSDISSPSYGKPMGYSGQNLQVPIEYGVRPVSPAETSSRSRSRTRGRSPLRTPIGVYERPAVEVPRSPSPVQDDTDSDCGECDFHDAPSLMVPCKLDIGSTLDLNGKRLPTLPNSPSSVLDEELQRIGVFKSPMFDMDALHSHFSTSTVASTNYSPDPFLQPNVSHFSECSTDTDAAVSPSSMTSSSTFNNDSFISSNRSIQTSEIAGFSPDGKTIAGVSGLRITAETEHFVPESYNYDTYSPPTPIPAGSSPDIRISGLHITKKPQGQASQMDTYSCDPQLLDSGIRTPRVSGIQMQQDTKEDALRLPSLHVHTMMQEIMDELSYLGGVININDTEE